MKQWRRWRRRVRRWLLRRLLFSQKQLFVGSFSLAGSYNPDDYETLIVKTKVAKALLDDTAVNPKTLAQMIAEGYRPAVEAAIIRRLEGAEH